MAKTVKLYETKPKQRRAVLEPLVGREVLEQVAERTFRMNPHLFQYTCQDNRCVIGRLMSLAGLPNFGDMPGPTRSTEALRELAGLPAWEWNRAELDPIYEVISDLMALNDAGRLTTRRQVRRSLGLEG